MCPKLMAISGSRSRSESESPFRVVAPLPFLESDLLTHKMLHQHGISEQLHINLKSVE